MPAVRPRITVVLDPEVLEVVQRAARVQKQSVSRVVGELVTEMAPALERVASFGEAFEASTVAQKDALRAGINAADDRVQGLVQEALVALAALDEAVVSELSGDSSGGPADPPLVTRG